MTKKLEKFYDHLLIKLGFGEVTIGNYRTVLKKFFRDIGTIKPKKSQAEQYLIEIVKGNYSYSHIANSSIIISRYMEFIKRAIEFTRPRKPKTLIVKEILTEGEIARVLAATNNSREKAMISILAYCGLRNKEVCQLKIRDIDFVNSLIKVIGGKFKKDRIVPMSRECSQIILDYLRDYPREDDRLFTTLIRDNNYTGWDLRKRVKVVAKRANIKKRVYPHLFRHSFISHLIDRGANIIAVQQFAGHSDIKTTMLYTHLTPKKIQQEYMYHIPSYL